MVRYHILLAGFIVALLGCSGSSTSGSKDVATSYKINLAGVGAFDSVVAVYTVNESDTMRTTFLPAELDSSGNVLLTIEAPKNARVNVQTLVWKNSKVLATQEGSVTSGSKAQLVTATMVPNVSISAPSVCYLDLPNCVLVGLAHTRSATAATQLKSIAFDYNGDGVSDTTRSGGSLGSDSLSLALNSIPGLVAGKSQSVILKVTEISGRIFYDTLQIQVQASASVITDSRDGQVYGYRQIGTQVWMTQNLNYLPTGSKDSSWCYANDTANCAQFGRLYDWTTAMAGSTASEARGICPTGWHVPSQAEFTLFTRYADSADNLIFDGSTISLKSDSTWTTGAGTDLFGFKALAGGYYAEAQFYCQGTRGIFWTSTQSSAPWAWYNELTSWSGAFNGSHATSDGYSLRCVQDATAL